MNPFQIPIPKSPFVDIKTGLVNREWYLYLNNLFLITGGSVGTASQVLHGAGTGYSEVNLSLDVIGTLLAAQFPALTGDVVTTAGSLATTITANAVTNTKLAQMAALTLKGNNTALTANAADLTATQALAVLGVGSQITNSLAGDVMLNNTANYFDGPVVAQGTTGTWVVSGTVTVTAGVVLNVFNVLLWDGTTIIATTATQAAATLTTTVSLSGIIASPAGNLRISVNDSTGVDGLIVFNASGLSHDSTLTAFRIA